jgi:hypothetical protein
VLLSAITWFADRMLTDPSVLSLTNAPSVPASGLASEKFEMPTPNCSGRYMS